jgi:hypothetical protein
MRFPPKKNRSPEAALDLWWAVPGALAGMPMPFIHPERWDRPRSALDAYSDDLPTLVAAGIGAVVSFLHLPRAVAMYEATGFGFQLMPIPDGDAPSLKQFEAFLEFMYEQRAQGRVVAAHCAAGLGRTGTVLAGYLIVNGIPFEAAVRRIRAARPGAIETRPQMEFLYRLASAQQ